MPVGSADFHVIYPLFPRALLSEAMPALQVVLFPGMGSTHARCADLCLTSEISVATSLFPSLIHRT